MVLHVHVYLHVYLLPYKCYKQVKAISLKLHPVCIQCGVLTQSSTNILSTSDEESNKGKYKKFQKNSGQR